MSALFRGESAPNTKRLDAHTTARDFSYRELLTLSATYRKWAAESQLDDPRYHRLLDWAADCQAIANWVGAGWMPGAPQRHNVMRAVLKGKPVFPIAENARPERSAARPAPDLYVVT